MPNGQGTPDDWAREQQHARYVNGVITRAMTDLTPLLESGDIEGAHAAADEVLCAALVAFGARDIVDMWRQVPKWYA